MSLKMKPAQSCAQILLAAWQGLKYEGLCHLWLLPCKAGMVAVRAWDAVGGQGLAEVSGAEAALV